MSSAQVVLFPPVGRATRATAHPGSTTDRCLGVGRLAWLALAVSACGGGATTATAPAAPEQPPETPAESWAASESAPAAPKESEASSRLFDEGERVLLCGPTALTVGAASFDAVLQQVQDGDRSLGEKAAVARAAAEAQCRDAVDALDNVFQQLAASSRTLCDYQFARGVGATGDELLARTGALLASIDDRVAAIASGTPCPQQADRLAADVERWRGQRSQICAPTAEQEKVRSCGVEATDTSQAQQAKSYCDALATNGRVDALLARPIEQCVARALQAAP